MKNQFARDFLTGLTTIVGIAGLIITLAAFGELKNLMQRHYSFTLRMDQAGGLSTSSAVTLNGVRVGTIQQLANAPDPRDGVNLTLRIREGVQIPTNFGVYIDKSLVGDASLDLVIPRGGTGLPALVAGGETYEREATGLFDQLADSVKDPLARLGQTAEKIDRFAETYTKVGERIDQMLSPRTPAEVLAGAEPNVSSAIARVDTLLGSAQEWVGDGSLREGAKGLIDKAGTTLEGVDRGAASIADAGRALREQIESSGGQVDAMLEQASATLRRVDEAASEIGKTFATINSGEGTAGLLLNNPDIYNTVRDAAKRLERMLTEVQLLVEKYRTEGLPIKL